MHGILLHEWIEKSGGAEQVFDQMVRAFPDSDLWCLWNDAPERFESSTVKQSWLAHTPLRKRKALALPFMPATWRKLPCGDAEFALISSHLFAHQATFDSPAIEKFVYTHTPARYIWEPELDGRGDSKLVRSVSPALRKLDKARVSPHAHYAANSEFIRERIKRCWDTDAKVIYPPVAITAMTSIADWTTELTAQESELLESIPEDFVFGASRFVDYKRLDWVIQAAEMNDIAVVIAGSGPSEAKLAALAEAARVPAFLLHRPSDALLYALYQRCNAYVFPPIEDFGIMPVEALAAGATVIANSIGGASESVTEGFDGRLFEEDNVESVAEALKLELASPSPPRDINQRRARYARFSEERFVAELQQWVSSTLQR